MTWRPRAWFALLALPEDALLHLARYLSLEELMRLRVGSRKLLNTYTADVPVWSAIRPACLSAVVKRAQTSGLYFLNYLYQLGATDVGKKDGLSALDTACKDNDIAKISWLTCRFSYTFREIADAAECASRAGHLASMKALAIIFNILEMSSIRYPLFLRMIYAALNHGHSEVVRWLLELTRRPGKTGARYDIAPSDAIDVFRAACQGPNMNCLVEVSNALRITQEQVRANERIFLGDACFAGRVGNAQWLIRRFGLTAADLRKSNYCAVRRACEGSYYWLASMLIEFLQITPHEIRPHVPTPAFTAMLCEV